MIGIKYLEKSVEYPNGAIYAEIFEEASWLFQPEDFPFKFTVKSNDNIMWSSNLHPNTWSFYHCLFNENVVASIEDNQGNILSNFKLDIWVNRNSTEQFFDMWIKKNPNSNGIVIGTHDGTSGEWVKHVKNNKTNALLVEGSDKQFNDLVNNYKDLKNTKTIKSVVTGDGRYVNFFEFGEGHTNTVDEDHYKKHIKYVDNDVNIINIKSISINDLIIQYGLKDTLDWIHLDTEAIDDEIIMGIDFSRIKKPRLIVFETINFSEERTGKRDRIDTLFNWLNSNGYKTKYDYWNSFAFLP